jgi:GMP synthase (glutamine-hydrolysing) A subunit
MPHDKIAVVDFGGQYAHLIATKIRRLRVLAEIRQPEDPTALFAQYKGIVLSGSPSLSAFGEDSVYNKAIYDLPVPIVGFCFGHQEIAKHYGGQVVHGGREWGAADLHVLREHALFAGLSRREPVWMSHFDSVVAVGPDFEELGYTTLGAGGEAGHRYAAIASDRHRRYGFQFHPEVDDTVHGEAMLANFVYSICGCTPSWTMEHFLDEQVARVRAQVGDRSVFLLASGGVDSTVAAKLLGLAVGPDRLHLLHIDNGLMRKNESAQVLATLAALGLDRHLNFVDASDDFLRALEASSSPSGSAGSSATRSSRCSSARRGGSASSITCSARGPSIRTPSRPAARSERTRSRRITTACRSSRRCSPPVASWSRWRSCTRWRCASLASSSACRQISSGGIRFRARGSACVSCVPRATRIESTSTRSRRRWRVSRGGSASRR